MLFQKAGHFLLPVFSLCFYIKNSSSERKNKKLLLEEERIKQDKELQSRCHYILSREKQEITRKDQGFAGTIRKDFQGRGERGEDAFFTSTVRLSNFLVNASEMSNKRQGL